MSPTRPSIARGLENHTATKITTLLITARMRGRRCPCMRVERCIPQRLTNWCVPSCVWCPYLAEVAFFHF